MIGASGMLGSMLCRVLSEHGYFVAATYSNRKPTNLPVGDMIRFTYHLGDDCSSLRVGEYDYVVNCAGLIKQKTNVASDLYAMNSLFPRNLTQMCSSHMSRMIHFSTDCIFSGRKKTPYHKNDPCDADDDYGVSKYLGESANQILFRTSIFGPSSDSYGLFEWFRGMIGGVSGYNRHIWSGLTTLELANQVAVAIREKWGDSLYQLSVDPISKYDLLCMTNRIFEMNKTIVPIETSCVNRSLISDYCVKSIEQQLLDLRIHCDRWNLL